MDSLGNTFWGKVANWAEAREQSVLAKGRSLVEAEQEMARQLGVRRADQVRVLEVGTIILGDPEMEATNARMGLISEATQSLTLGYGIELREERREDRALLARELRRVSQFEWLGSKEAFIRLLVQETEFFGPDRGPLMKDTEYAALPYALQAEPPAEAKADEETGGEAGEAGAGSRAGA